MNIRGHSMHVLIAQANKLSAIFVMKALHREITDQDTNLGVYTLISLDLGNPQIGHMQLECPTIAKMYFDKHMAVLEIHTNGKNIRLTRIERYR